MCTLIVSVKIACVYDNRNFPSESMHSCMLPSVPAPSQSTCSNLIMFSSCVQTSLMQAICHTSWMIMKISDQWQHDMIVAGCVCSYASYMCAWRCGIIWRHGSIVSKSRADTSHQYMHLVMHGRRNLAWTYPRLEDSVLLNCVRMVLSVKLRPLVAWKYAQ